MCSSTSNQESEPVRELVVLLTRCAERVAVLALMGIMAIPLLDPAGQAAACTVQDQPADHTEVQVEVTDTTVMVEVVVIWMMAVVAVAAELAEGVTAGAADEGAEVTPVSRAVGTADGTAVVVITIISTITTILTMSVEVGGTRTMRNKEALEVAALETLCRIHQRVK